MPELDIIMDQPLVRFNHLCIILSQKKVFGKGRNLLCFKKKRNHYHKSPR